MTDNKSGEILIIEDDKDINDLLATALSLSLIHISEPTRRTPISYAVFCLKKKKKAKKKKKKYEKKK